MKFLKMILVVITLILPTLSSIAHDKHAADLDSSFATYLGNEAVMMTSDNNKILFDPFFHNSYKIYQLVPEDIREKIMSGTVPYDNINAIFISHAHEDHFSAQDVLHYLTLHPNTKLVAPKQAIDTLTKLAGAKKTSSQLIAVSLNYGDKPWHGSVGSLQIEAIRIPHSGWPSRAEVENIIFRITFNNQVSVMHMGDADAEDIHFKPYKESWHNKHIDTAFPPYWFYFSDEGKYILEKRINAKHTVGVHVPINTPDRLKKGKNDYFSKPGEKREIKHNH